MTAAGPQILPAFVAASSAGPDRSRTLVLRQDGGALSYTVLRNTDPLLGEPELAQTPSATHVLDSVVAALDTAAGGDGGNTGQALSQFDIGYVLLPAPVDQSLAHQLDGAAGLVSLTQGPAFDLWQVAGTVARVRVIGPDRTVVPVPSGPIGVHAVIAAGTSGTLVLAEAAGGWSATLNGRPLAALAEPVDGWAQGFVLPAGGGRLIITRDETARDISLAAEAAAVLVVFALALPGTRAMVPAPAVQAEPDLEATPTPGRRRDRVSGPGLALHKRRPRFASAGSAEIHAAARAEARVGGGYGADGEHWAEPASAVTGAPSGSPPGPPPGSPSGPPPGPSLGAAGRPHGGQHAARRGKQSRRWRGDPANGDRS